MKKILMGLGCFALFSCGPELTLPTSDEVALVDATAWALTTNNEDPFDDAPESAECPSSGYGIEDDFFEIETDACEYATFVQPSKLAVSKEQEIRLNFWHSPLSNPEPAEAHVALQIDDQLLWEKTIAIPNDAMVYDEILSLEDNVTKGASIYFHLHNHGNNAWRLGTIETSPP